MKVKDIDHWDEHPHVNFVNMYTPAKIGASSTEMIPLCLIVLTLVIDDLRNLGQGQHLRKMLLFEACIFPNNLPMTNLADRYKKS